VTSAVSKRRSRAANEADVIPSRRRGISAQSGIPRRCAPRNDTWLVTLFVVGLGVSPAYAQTPTPEGPSLLPLVLTFVFVLALIPIAVWMLKRIGAGNISAAAGLRVVAQLPLGQRERLVVVEAGDRWLILGVTPSSINRLGTLPKGELPPTTGAGGSFAGLLMQARRGRENG
jgi:flagellar protein FliO/FliZ